MNPLERRFQADRLEVERAYGDHPAVQVTVEGEGADTRFTVAYDAVTAAIDPVDGQPVVIPTPVCVITYPADYPRSAPLVTSDAAVFHPAASSEDESSSSWTVGTAWAPADRVADVIERVGRLLQFQDTGTSDEEADDVADDRAAGWVAENEEIFPLGTVDVSPRGSRRSDATPDSVGEPPPGPNTSIDWTASD